MQEWFNWHAWKACVPQKGTGGSNPPLSAKAKANPAVAGFFVLQWGWTELAIVKTHCKTKWKHEVFALALKPPLGGLPLATPLSPQRQITPTAYCGIFVFKTSQTKFEKGIINKNPRQVKRVRSNLELLDHPKGLAEGSPIMYYVLLSMYYVNKRFLKRS